jgi:hypothetical protein
VREIHQIEKMRHSEVSILAAHLQAGQVDGGVDLSGYGRSGTAGERR